VTFSYNAGQSASRFIVAINNVTEYDSQWVCTPTPNQTMVNNINNALLPYGPPTPSYLSASIANITPAYNNTDIYFNKTQATLIAKVNVYNPFNTTCSFTMSCPTPVPPYVTPPVNIPCGGLLSINGGWVPSPYYKDYTIQLGSGTGTVVLTYNAYEVPDRFQIIYENSIVLDTYWRGQQQYRSNLNAMGFTEMLYTNTNTNPAPTDPGVGTGSFEKTTSTPTAILRVYSPLSGPGIADKWFAIMHCPV
jgi:hypothetical protein